MAKNYIQVIRHYEAAPEQVKKYFPSLVELVETYNWEVPVSYAFSQLERAKRMTLYCGIVKLHWCESELTRRRINEDHLSRGRFKKLFKVVFGKSVPPPLIEKLERVEDIRDKISHGMPWKPAEARAGLVSLIDFAVEFNDYMAGLAGFRPFDDLRGFKGRKESLTPDTTRWVLLGMGIPEKEQK